MEGLLGGFYCTDTIYQHTMYYVIRHYFGFNEPVGPY